MYYLKHRYVITSWPSGLRLGRLPFHQRSGSLSSSSRWGVWRYTSLVQLKEESCLNCWTKRGSLNLVWPRDRKFLVEDYFGSHWCQWLEQNLLVTAAIYFSTSQSFPEMMSVSSTREQEPYSNNSNTSISWHVAIKWAVLLKTWRNTFSCSRTRTTITCIDPHLVKQD